MSALDLDGLSDAQLRLYAVCCVRRVQRLMTDPRSVAVLDVAERHAKGDATDKELSTAWAAASDAAAALWAAASDAPAASRAAAWAAASAAAAEAAAEAAADAAWDAARAAATAAWDAERAEQQKILGEVREVKPCV